MRRYSAEWMTIVDDRILEYIYEEGSGSPTQMTEEGIKASQPHISRRCSKLANHGLLVHLGNGVYQITEDGEAYLEGELDASELEIDKE
ncbi:MAG: ArsR family transcriptional regulator [Halobacteriaceae archaeon]